LKKEFIIGLLVLAAVLTGCKKPATTQAAKVPVIHQIKLAPSPPMQGSALTAKVEIESDPKDGRVTQTFKWYRDGELLKDYTEAVLPGAEVTTGAEFQVEVQAANPSVQSPWFKSEKVKAGEPRFHFNNIWIEPETPKKTDTLVINFDCDDCRGKKMYYRWLINDKTVEGADQAQLGGAEAGFKPGDQVTGEIAVEEEYPDFFHETTPVKIQAQNLFFVDSGKVWLADKTVYFQFRAQDPDGGPVTYSLLESPAGASLDQAAARVTWPVPEGFSGKADFKVSAKNNAGQEAFLTGGINLSIQENKPTP
jgi:hypothetical protein